MHIKVLIFKTKDKKDKAASYHKREKLKKIHARIGIMDASSGYVHFFAIYLPLTFQGVFVWLSLPRVFRLEIKRKIIV